MRGYWDKTFHHRVSIKSYSGLEIADGKILGLAELPAVEQLVHFIPTKPPTLTWVGLTLPGETEPFTASIYQNVYNSAAQSIKILTRSHLTWAICLIRYPESYCLQGEVYHRWYIWLKTLCTINMSQVQRALQMGKTLFMVDLRDACASPTQHKSCSYSLVAATLWLTSIISNSEVSVSELLGGLEEEPLAYRGLVLVHSANCLDHLLSKTGRLCAKHTQEKHRTTCELKISGFTTRV